MQSRIVRRLFVGLALAAAASAGAVYYVQDGQSSQTPEKKRARPAAPVIVASVSTRSVPVRIETIGTVQSRSTVAVKSRVDGQLMEVGFEEGQPVRKGDLLFRIDPRPFEASLRQAEANLARDIAQMEKAKADLTRYEELTTKGYASQQKYEEARAILATAGAAIRADQAAIEMARLQLGYTTIHSPIDGRTGNLLVNAGNLVKGNDTQVLVVINETNPIYVSFTVPEKDLPAVKQYSAEGQLTIEAAVPHDTRPPLRGKLFFINNTVDTASGTIQLKAHFDNADERLTPGQFVNVSVRLATLENALVVPERAVQTGQKGTYVFVMNDEKKTVQPRVVETGPLDAGMVVVEKGLKLGEIVVTDGQLRLFPGARVAPKIAGAEPGKAKAKDEKDKPKDQDTGKAGKPKAES